ncbi:MAG TPA: hypothetical protein VGR89_04440 [Puia sp.]|nr:hypothetical protein [Puia sp.]
MKRIAAIMVWGLLLWGIGTFLDQVRSMLMLGEDPVKTYIIRFGFGFGLVIIIVLAGRWFGPRVLSPGDWFMAGVLAWLVQGGYTAWMKATPTGGEQTFDINVHDTYFVISTWHLIAGIVLLYVLVGLVYYLGRGMNRILGNVHFFVTHAALFVLFWMQYFNPAYQVKGYLEWHEYYQNLAVVDWAYVGMAILLASAQILFVVNLFLMAFGCGGRGGRRDSPG